MGAKRELIFHTRDRSLVQKQSFLNNFVQDCRRSDENLREGSTAFGRSLGAIRN